MPIFRIATVKRFYLLAYYAFRSSLVSFRTRIRGKQHLEGLQINDAEVGLGTPAADTVVVYQEQALALSASFTTHSKKVVFCTEAERLVAVGLYDSHQEVLQHLFSIASDPGGKHQYL